MSKKMKRFVVTLADESKINADEVIHALQDRGFHTEQRLREINCVLGEFSGEGSELEKIPGVIEAAPEEQMHSQ